MAEPNELLRRIARVGADIDPGLSDRDVERLVEGARGRRRRRAVARAGMGLAATGIAIAAAVVFHGRQPAPVAVAVGPAPAAAPVRLADGSVATPLDDASEITVREDAPQKVAIDLARGRGHFDVAPRPDRTFSVRAGDVTVTVIGTVFTVERVADRIGVTVTRGRVLVDWGVGSRGLSAGESGWFPPLVVGEPASTGATSTGATSTGATTTTTTSRSRSRSRSRSTSAIHAERVVAPPPVEAPPSTDAETAETLLAAADTARLQGRAQDGAALLRRIVKDHRADPRAPLAAFTLGRVLLMELGQPRAAAAAFAEARALAQVGPFAEDALAREVEAWAKAGDRAKARARAQEYLLLYPSGRRVAAVRALGGGA
jgi:transmembrane sensor